MILVIDNYDSFTWNLVQLARQLSDEPVEVFRNDDTALDSIDESVVSRIIISPGPGRPEDAGRSIDVVRNIEQTPILGVCLGHQAIAVGYGANVGLAPVPRHGKPSRIEHESQGLFRGCPRSFEAIRYHSLVVERSSVPAELEVVATTTEDRLVMALKHRARPVFGLQFHPESYGSEAGEILLRNFLVEDPDV